LCWKNEEADTKIKNYINQEKDLEAQLFVALSEESGLSYQEMKELILHLGAQMFPLD